MKVERSRHAVLVKPPDVERLGAEFWEIPGLAPGVGETAPIVVICADYERATQWAELAPAEFRAHAVTGLTRTAALLKEGRIGLLAGAPADLAALVARSALKLDSVEALVLAWPESFAGELDALLAEAPDARRVILSWNPPALSEFLERHARRAEVIGDMPLDSVGRALGPVAAARYTIVAAARRATAVRDVLDSLRAARPYVWNGGAIETPDRSDAVVAAVLPTREELRSLAAIGQPVVIALASQLAYLRSIATLTPLPLPSMADRAQDRNAELRARIAARIESGDLDAELAVLGPLFEGNDPAMVAAALLAISRQSSVVSEPATAATDGGWTKVFVTVGRKDGASAKDLVGALIKEAGLQKGQIGKIEVRESFSLVDISPQIAEQAVRRLTGVSIRGRRVAARPDRG